MNKMAYVLGGLALVLGIASFTPDGSEFLYGGLKPISVILFGAAFICKLLAREYADYDREKRKQLDSAADEAPRRVASAPDARDWKEKHA
jgi:hypothetical protein